MKQKIVTLTEDVTFYWVIGAVLMGEIPRYQCVCYSLLVLLF